MQSKSIVNMDVRKATTPTSFAEGDRSGPVRFLV